MGKVTFIDLFAGIGATRLGFEQACKELGLNCECVFTSEIKPYATKVYADNFKGHLISGDITQIDAKDIPNFDYLLGGFPCQSFSSAGARRGFEDTRGTLFFDVARIIKEKQPKGFLLENVEGLVNHDGGKTLSIIMDTLKELGYNATWKIINSVNFGVCQSRKRIYIIGNKEKIPSFDHFSEYNRVVFGDIQEHGKEIIKTKFSDLLLKHYSPTELLGKSIKDKRGGDTNIHSRDIEYRGPITKDQRHLMSLIMKERRKKHRASKKGILRMDGMPLTIEEISTFYSGGLFGDTQDLSGMLDDLVSKGYMKLEHPKDMVKKELENGSYVNAREYKQDIPKGYNIVVGKLSFPVSKILDPKGYTPTIVATDANKIAVVDGNGIRNLTVIEGKRLFGIPDEFIMDVEYNKAFDLLGNTVVVPVIKEVSKLII